MSDIFCAAAQCTSVAPSFEKVDFSKLQNGRYVYISSLAARKATLEPT